MMAIRTDAQQTIFLRLSLLAFQAPLEGNAEVLTRNLLSKKRNESMNHVADTSLRTSSTSGNATHRKTA
jgi:hypothetical protein